VPVLEGNGRGDQFVTAVVVTPTELSPRARELFKELAKIEEQTPVHAGKNFFEKLKDAVTGGDG
jgi:molecular chaperone DnaJ